MQYRLIAAVTAPLVLAIAAVGRPPGLQAQTASSPRPIPAALQVGSLSRERAARWAGASPVIHCSPAPLTERPGAAAELARPHVVPLEEAFLDAAIAKRTFAARTQPLGGRVREQRAR